jgi:hypothetical protein
LKHFLVAASSTLLLSACTPSTPTTNYTAIVMGDSSTIVTEKDAQYLKNNTLDFKPTQTEPGINSKTIPPANTTKDTAVAVITKTKDSSNTNTTPQGFNTHWDKVNINWSQINLKEVSSTGNTYRYKSADKNTQQAAIAGTGLKNIAIKQRYRSTLMLSSSRGNVDLRQLGTYTSGWNTINVQEDNGKFTALPLQIKNVQFLSVNHAKIKKAVEVELTKRKASQKDKTNWLKEIRQTHTAKDSPCSIIVNQIELQLTGTGKDGKSFQKQIVIDL